MRPGIAIVSSCLRGPSHPGPMYLPLPVQRKDTRPPTVPDFALPCAGRARSPKTAVAGTSRATNHADTADTSEVSAMSGALHRGAPVRREAEPDRVAELHRDGPLKREHPPRLFPPNTVV